MIPDLPHAAPEEVAALYAAGALTPVEHQACEALLARGAPSLDAELLQLDPVIAALAQAVPPVTPSPRIKESLLNRIRAAGQTPLPVETKAPAAKPTSNPPPIPEGFFYQHAADAVWMPTRTPGVQIRMLYLDKVRQRATVCLKMEPGRHYPHHDHASVEEVFVLEGDLRLGDIVMRAGDYQRAEGGTHHEDQYTENGCMVLIQMSTAALQ